MSDYKVQIGNAILDAKVFGTRKILKNIFLSYLEGYNAGDKDEDFDNQISKLEVTNRGTTYEKNVRNVLSLLSEELERLETKPINSLNITFNKKKFTFDSEEDEEGRSFSLNTDEFDFSLKDLQSDSKINELLGLGEYTQEFEDLTSTKDITREINEKLDKSFPTLFKYVQENLKISTSGSSVTLGFDDEDFTMNVLREFSPSQLSFKREGSGGGEAFFDSRLTVVETENPIEEIQEDSLDFGNELERSWQNIFYKLGFVGKRSKLGPYARLKNIEEGSRDAAELFLRIIFSGDKMIKVFNDAYNVSNEIVDVEVTIPTKVQLNPREATDDARAVISNDNANALQVPIEVRRISSGTMTWTSTNKPGQTDYIRAINRFDPKMPGEFPAYFPTGMKPKDSEPVIDALEDFLYSTAANYMELKETIEEALEGLTDTSEEEE